MNEIVAEFAAVAILAFALIVVLSLINRARQHRSLKPGRLIEYTNPAGKILSGEIVEHVWTAPTVRVRSDDEQEYEVPLSRVTWLET